MSTPDITTYLPHWRDLRSDMPEERLIAALDDDADGIADDDAWQAVLAGCAARLAAVAGDPTVISAIPRHAVAYAVRVWALETLYTRRGIIDGNPYTKKATDAETQLRRHAERADGALADSAITVIGKPSKISHYEGTLP